MDGWIELTPFQSEYRHHVQKLQSISRFKAVKCKLFTHNIRKDTNCLSELSTNRATLHELFIHLR